MRTATVHELKEELKQVPASELLELCLRLAKFKKENKELLTFLLFEANDLPAYIEWVKSETAAGFAAINQSQLYFAKKSLRKILRGVNKYIRYTGSKQAEIELLLDYCHQLKNSGIPIQKSQAIKNIMEQQLKKIQNTLSTLHEDLQYDYLKELRELEPEA